MSAVMPLERITEALDLLRSGSAMKVAISGSRSGS